MNYRNNRTFEGRVMELINNKLLKFGFNQKKYKYWIIHNKWIKDRSPPTYIFKINTNTLTGSSISNGGFTTQLGISKKYKSLNLRGIVEIKKFLHSILYKQPLIDELADFIIAYTYRKIQEPEIVKETKDVSIKPILEKTIVDNCETINEPIEEIKLIGAPDGDWESLID